MYFTSLCNSTVCLIRNIQLRITAMSMSEVCVVRTQIMVDIFVFSLAQIMNPFTFSALNKESLDNQKKKEETAKGYPEAKGGGRMKCTKKAWAKFLLEKIKGIFF